MADLAASDLIGRAPGVLTRRLLDDLLILPPGSAEPVRVTEPGPLLWHLLAIPTTVERLANELASIHRTPSDLVCSDITPVLASLVDAGALTWTRPG